MGPVGFGYIGVKRETRQREAKQKRTRGAKAANAVHRAHQKAVVGQAVGENVELHDAQVASLTDG
eukprot:5401889-Prymnesium_polylepis.1